MPRNRCLWLGLLYGLFRDTPATAATTNPPPSPTIVVGVNAKSITTTASPPDSHLDFPRYKAEHLRFHGDDVCDREAYNDYKRSLNRALRKRALAYFVADNDDNDNAYHFPPTERVLHCPDENDALPDWSVPEIALDTTWLVENTAPHKVVVTRMQYDDDPTGGEREVSPLDDGTEAIIAPGEFQAIPAFEGHVYRVRQFVSNDEVNDGVSLGRILLQYRAGVRTVGGNTNLTAAVDCPQPDVEPPRHDTTKARTRPKKNLKCHSIETGFRNLSPCPLNAYFAHNGTEAFRFHLGTNPSVALAMKEDWTSAVKFETSYIPHAYIFRNAQTNDFVERYVLQPTRVVDCSKKNAQDAIILPSGEVVHG